MSWCVTICWVRKIVNQINRNRFEHYDCQSKCTCYFIKEIEERYLKGIKFHYVSEMKEVIDYALLDQKVKSARSIS